MFVHVHVETHSSAQIGTRLVEVACERCGCRFAYRLARVGSGETSTVYGLGARRAEEKAARKAQADLNRRLEEDAELVPCPNCQWINEALVVGYRRGRYRNWTTGAWGLVAAGGATALVTGFCWAVVPGSDGATAAMIAGGGIGLALGLAAALLGLRGWLRRRIDPNRDHPFTPPSLPVGSPPALRYDPTTRRLEPVAPPAPDDERGGSKLHIQLGRSDLPRVCCGCGGAPDPEATHKRVVIKPLILAVPLCHACAGHWTRARRIGATVGGMITALAAGLLLYWAYGTTDEFGFWVFLVGSTAVGSLLGLGVAATWAAPVRIRLVDRPRGVVRLWFRNRASILGPIESAAVDTG